MPDNRRTLLQQYSDSPQRRRFDFSSLPTTNNRPVDSDYLSHIYWRLRDHGYDDSHIAALLGTIAEESGGNPFAVSDDGRFTGLLQWSDGRYRMPEGARSNPYAELDRQVDHILDTIDVLDDRLSWTYGGNGSGYSSNSEAHDDWVNSKDLYDQVHAINWGYVRPSGQDASVRNRYRVGHAAYDIISPRQYKTELSEDDEKQFRNWYGLYSKANGLNPDPDNKEHYYDIRGYWKAAKELFPIGEVSGHLPDTYKTPGHPTFSDESMYAKEAPELAGHWVGDEYVPANQKAFGGNVYSGEQDGTQQMFRLGSLEEGPYAVPIVQEIYGGDIEPAVVVAAKPERQGIPNADVPVWERPLYGEFAYDEPVLATPTPAVAQRQPVVYDTPQFVEVGTPRDAVAVRQPLAEEVAQYDAADVNFINDVASGKPMAKAVNTRVGELKSGDDLKPFQEMLLREGYYRNLPTPKITAKTKDEVIALQAMLKAAGYDLGNYGENKDGVDGKLGRKTREAWAKYCKEHPDEALVQTVADGKVGQATRDAAKRYYSDVYAAGTRMVQEEVPVVEEVVDETASQPVKAVAEPVLEEVPTIVPDVPVISQTGEHLSFPEYMYRSGQVGAMRRAQNVASAMRNYANGLLNPHGSNATMSEGARRQMVGASLAHHEKTGKYAVTDTEHAALGGMEGHSGTEFRKDSGKREYFKQLADAPYHNIYGQSGRTYDEETGVFSPGPDAYTFNNVWTGNKVTEVKDDGAGTGSLSDAFDEFMRARESGASIKAAMESAASIRGTDVKPKSGRRNSVSQKDLERYRKEYEEYLNNPKKRERFERKLQRLGLSGSNDS